MTSDIAKTYEKTQKVETLMNRLAEYMAGDIPEDNIGDLITGDDETPKHSQSSPTIPLASLEPKEVFRDPNLLEIEPVDVKADDYEIDYGDGDGDGDDQSGDV